MIQRHILAAAALGSLWGMFPAATLAQEGAPPGEAGRPHIMVRETNFEFGYTPQNAKISHEFWLINDGGDTLRLTDIKAP